MFIYWLPRFLTVFSLFLSLFTECCAVLVIRLFFLLFFLFISPFTKRLSFFLQSAEEKLHSLLLLDRGRFPGYKNLYVKRRTKCDLKGECRPAKERQAAEYEAELSINCLLDPENLLVGEPGLPTTVHPARRSLLVPFADAFIPSLVPSVFLYPLFFCLFLSSFTVFRSRQLSFFVLCLLSFFVPVFAFVLPSFSLIPVRSC